MYWPTGAASRLSLSTASTPDDAFYDPLPSPDVTRIRGSFLNSSAPNDRKLSSSGASGKGGSSNIHGRDGEVLDMTRSRTGALWASLTADEIAVWSTRPKVVVTKVKRTVLSLRALGTNQSVEWRPDDRVLVVLTSSSNILLFSLQALPSTTTIYSLPTTMSEQFTAGPGEGLESPPIVLRSAGELHIERGEAIACLCATPSHLIISIQKPEPAVRSIPWPASTRPDGYPPSVNQQTPHAIPLSSIDWLVDPTAHIISITYSRPLGIYVFITSDGRAYSTRRQPGRMPLKPLPVRESMDEETETEGDESHDASLPQAAATDWEGVCFYPPPQEGNTSPVLFKSAMPRKERAVGSTGSIVQLLSPNPDEFDGGEGILNGVGAEPSDVQEVRDSIKNPATGVCAVNAKFNLVVIGLSDGTLSVHVLGHPSRPSKLSHTLQLRKSLNSTASGLETGEVTSCAWTSDGHALAVSWTRGFSIWSVYGRLQAWVVGGQGNGAETDVRGKGWEDLFMNAGRKVFWGPGNFELFILTPPPSEPKKRMSDEQLFTLPFAKSAVTTLHSPDNTKHAFLQLDDRVLVYRGADQPDMSVINPESDVWQHIKIPVHYIGTNWPIKYACISNDAKLIAVAGKRGLTHYNALSGRWKLFESENQEQSFCIRGGMQWYGNVLIAAVDQDGIYSLQLFSRDDALSLGNCLHRHVLSSPVVLTSIFDNSLLVYTADNTLYHFLILPIEAGVRLRIGGSIGFEGVVGNPARVRGMSWLIPRSQRRFGDPADDLNVATIIFLIDGKLVLLRPRRAADEEVKYDMQILADHIEFYWSHLSGIGTLENSLWGWDGKRIQVWLDALTIEGARVDEEFDSYEAAEDNLAIELDFYPLSVLMDKGIIIGVDHEVAQRRSLDFALYRIMTHTHLFIHHVVRYHLSRSQLHEAVLFASYYDTLVYFSHSLEILLHSVLEEEADEADSRPITPLSEPQAMMIHSSNQDSSGVLPLVVEFLDHFPEALQVVVGCARKTEVRRWSFLFDVVGPPRSLFEISLERGLHKIAASYLLVLHNLDPLEQSSKDTIRLLKVSMAAGEWGLCKELLRFLYSLDHTGLILRSALAEASALPPGYEMPELAAPIPQLAHVTSSDSGLVAEEDISHHSGGFSSPPMPKPRSGGLLPSPEDDDDQSTASLKQLQSQHSLSTDSVAPPTPNLSSHRPGLGFGSLLARVGMTPSMSRSSSPSFDFSKGYTSGSGTRSKSRDVGRDIDNGEDVDE